jgi:hypothetical protein
MWWVFTPFEMSEIVCGLKKIIYLEMVNEASNLVDKWSFFKCSTLLAKHFITSLGDFKSPSP